ncbi:DUF1835 domain-containing protein [Heyndrickxia vini]|uniref:DUF1835 domain-containing protein n=1 Tax=Heyndrickxia vini TaxID=1476025 RepID=A0ABX7DYY3_9BACI|nr:DUF1835 domain-containing protein [Heyndrickxia vini]QQZ07737.1 DUF1835 domain-containing protein [Heyndrickxia vini]
MRSRVIHPFIYFFMEPNVVFVYKIVSDRYLSLSELHKTGEWKTYELNTDEEFDSFNHKESDPLIGRGYLISQTDEVEMLDRINKQIQKLRHLKRKEEIIPVHIVSFEHAAGCLRHTLENPKKVIGFPGSFSIGPIWKLEKKSGQRYRNVWLNDHINFDSDDYYYETSFNNAVREIEDISNKNPIYIWYANNAEEQTGLRFLIHLLKNKPNPIFLLNSSKIYDSMIQLEGDEQIVTYTSDLQPEHIRQIFELHKAANPLSDVERCIIQKEWEHISQSKSELRLYENNELFDAQKEYFDLLIVETLKNLHYNQDIKDFIPTGELIWGIIEKDALIDQLYLEYRIRELIYNGTLEIKGIPKSMRHYRVKLRRDR